MAEDQQAGRLRAPRPADELALRRFGPEVEAMASDWFANPVQDVIVQSRGDYSPTADGACEVMLPNGAVAFMKPRPGRPNASVVGREKVVSDLAYLLHLPAAPVVIRRPDAAHGPADFTALSLQSLPSGRLWDAGGAIQLQQLAPALEGMRVLWTWVADTDHGGHGQNLAWEVDADGGRISAFDHSYCLSHDGADQANIGASGGYGTAAIPDVLAAREATVARIAALPWANVVSIVSRLGEVLTEEDRGRMLTVLEVRRGNLQQLIGG